MKYYFDTSSLVKIYHSEPGTSDVLKIYKDSKKRILISELSRIEFLSTVYKKFREKEFTSDTLDALINKFQDDTNLRYEILQFSLLITDEAENLIKRYADKHSLKILDSIQFAFFKVYCEQDIVFVCSDEKLSNLVRGEGFQVSIPQ